MSRSEFEKARKRLERAKQDILWARDALEDPAGQLRRYRLTAGEVDELLGGFRTELEELQAALAQRGTHEGASPMAGRDAAQERAEASDPTTGSSTGGPPADEGESALHAKAVPELPPWETDDTGTVIRTRTVVESVAADESGDWTRSRTVIESVEVGRSDVEPAASEPAEGEAGLEAIPAIEPWGEPIGRLGIPAIEPWEVHTAEPSVSEIEPREPADGDESVPPVEPWDVVE
ncbi:MAG TPA: hypothetical protein VER55_09565 [Ardenticatenaceae bacterium]|nr:hypothetical protein [Ardenticatenaceae bacterium]